MGSGRVSLGTCIHTYCIYNVTDPRHPYCHHHLYNPSLSLSLSLFCFCFTFSCHLILSVHPRITLLFLLSARVFFVFFTLKAEYTFYCVVAEQETPWENEQSVFHDCVSHTSEPRYHRKKRERESTRCVLCITRNYGTAGTASITGMHLKFARLYLRPYVAARISRTYAHKLLSALFAIRKNAPFTRILARKFSTKLSDLKLNIFFSFLLPLLFLSTPSCCSSFKAGLLRVNYYGKICKRHFAN